MKSCEFTVLSWSENTIKLLKNPDISMNRRKRATPNVPLEENLRSATLCSDKKTFYNRLGPIGSSTTLLEIDKHNGEKFYYQINRICFQRKFVKLWNQITAQNSLCLKENYYWYIPLSVEVSFIWNVWLLQNESSTKCWNETFVVRNNLLKKFYLIIDLREINKHRVLLMYFALNLLVICSETVFEKNYKHCTEPFMIRWLCHVCGGDILIIMDIFNYNRVDKNVIIIINVKVKTLPLPSLIEVIFMTFLKNKQWLDMDFSCRSM